MKRILIISIIIAMILLTSCNKNVTLECKDYKSYEEFLIQEQEDTYVMIHKTNCYYCKKLYRYVNELYDLGLDKICAFCVDEEKFGSLNLDSVPVLIYYCNGESIIIKTGYSEIRNFILDLIETNPK